MIPLISSEMSAHHWMTAEEISDLVAIAEMTPGPLGLNCATFAGMRAAWLPGALAAVFFERFKDSRHLGQIMVGVRPACIGLIAGAALTLSMTNYAEGGAVHLPSLCLGALDAFLLMKLKVRIPKVIGLSAALGLLLFGVLGL